MRSLILTQYQSVTDSRRTDGYAVAYTVLAKLALRRAVKIYTCQRRPAMNNTSNMAKLMKSHTSYMTTSSGVPRVISVTLHHFAVFDHNQHVVYTTFCLHLLTIINAAFYCLSFGKLQVQICRKLQKTKFSKSYHI